MGLGVPFQLLLHSTLAPVRGQRVRNAAFSKQSYKEEQDKTAPELQYKSSEPHNDTAR